MSGRTIDASNNPALLGGIASKRSGRYNGKTPGEDIERTLPNSLDAERSVLGAIMLHNDAFSSAARYVRAESFFRDAHRRIYAAIEKLLEPKGGSVDFLMLREYLSSHGDLEECGGPAYIASLIDGVPRSTNVEHYARIVQDKALLRALVFAANRVLTDAYLGEDPALEVLAQADRLIVELQHGAASGRMRSTAESATDLLTELEHRHAHRGQLSGVDTGFASINDLTGGWQRGDLIVIAARPSIGKTTFVMCSAVAAARAGKRVAVFSLEMRRQQIEFRLLSSLSGVPLSAILNGHLAEAHWGRISQAVGELAELRLQIDDAASRTVWDVRSECRRLRADGGLGLVIIDYVQLMQGSSERRGANRNEEITDISRKLKVLADDIDAPVILLSQLNRAGEIRADSRPKLSDLRESGALEQDADLVCFLHRRHHRESGVTNFIIEKARNGPTGTVNLTIERETTRFIDGGEDEPPEATADTPEQDHAAKVRALIKQRAQQR